MKLCSQSLRRSLDLALQSKLPGGARMAGIPVISDWFEKNSSSSSSSTYFRRTNLYLMVAIVIIEAYCTWILFSPETFPYTYLGPLGTFTKYIVTNHNTLYKIGYYGTWLIHVIEALYSFKTFEAKGITDRATQLKWFVQTLSFGIFSYGLLLVYNPPKKRK